MSARPYQVGDRVRLRRGFHSPLREGVVDVIHDDGFLFIRTAPYDADANGVCLTNDFCRMNEDRTGPLTEHGYEIELLEAATDDVDEDQADDVDEPAASREPATYECPCGLHIVDWSDDVASFNDEIADHEATCDGEAPVDDVDEAESLMCDHLDSHHRLPGGKGLAGCDECGARWQRELCACEACFPVRPSSFAPDPETLEWRPRSEWQPGYWVPTFSEDSPVRSSSQAGLASFVGAR